MGAPAHSHFLKLSHHFHCYPASQPPPAFRRPTRASFTSRLGDQGVQEITKKLEFPCYNVSLNPINPLQSTFFDTKNLIFRRLFLLGTFSPTLATYANVTLADMMAEAEVSRFRKTQSGVKIQDVLDGTGAEAKKGDQVEFNCVCRRANGYFVYSTMNQFSGESSPISLTLGTDHTWTRGGSSRYEAWRKKEGSHTTQSRLCYIGSRASTSRVWATEESYITCKRTFSI